jgi:small subunit ribosomal protein S6
MKQYYEFLGIIPGTLAENEITAVIKHITDFLISQGAEITYEENYGRKRMAYPIKHLRHGYYILVECNIDTEKLQTIEQKLTIDNKLLRFVFIKTRHKSREEREKEKTRMQVQTDKDKNRPDKKDMVTTEKAPIKLSLDELDKKLDEILDEKI